MILTPVQLAETALTLVSEYLGDLLDPAFEMNDWIDKKLCEQHCPDRGCIRTEEDMNAELDAVKAEIRDAVAALREALVSRLAAVSAR